jgi:cell division septum initiation protein DivIVA
MANPNNNQNAYHQALQINRDLKKEIDELKEKIKVLTEMLEEQINENHR